MTQLPAARDAFQRSLHEDPAFAPAWAWLGRCHRVIGKYVEAYAENDRAAEDAFRRALALSPDLPIAHRFFTHFESEHGRADAAIARLLQHAKANRNDAQLFAALVHACRYAGLMGASFAAHEEARRLDPTVPTSVEYTLLLAGDGQRLEMLPASPDVEGAHVYLLLFQGRTDAVRQRLERIDLGSLPLGYRGMLEAVRSATEDPAATLRAMESAMAIGAAHDPEAVFLAGMAAAFLGLDDRAMQLIESAVRAGYSAVHALEQSPTLASLRTRDHYGRILEEAAQRQHIARVVFERGDGLGLLGITAAQTI